MKKMAGIIVALMMIGCGGGGEGGGSSATPLATHETLTGTYRMTGFTFALSNGVVLTEASAPSYSGKMDIGPTRMYLLLDLAGNAIETEGSYTASWDSSTSGSIIESGDSMEFTLSGGMQTIILKQVPVSAGVTADGWFYFKKVTSAYTSRSVENDNTVTPEVVEGVGQLLTSLAF